MPKGDISDFLGLADDMLEGGDKAHVAIQGSQENDDKQSYDATQFVSYYSLPQSRH